MEGGYAEVLTVPIKNQKVQQVVVIRDDTENTPYAITLFHFKEEGDPYEQWISMTVRLTAQQASNIVHTLSRRASG